MAPIHFRRALPAALALLLVVTLTAHNAGATASVAPHSARAKCKFVVKKVHGKKKKVKVCSKPGKRGTPTPTASPTPTPAATGTPLSNEPNPVTVGVHADEGRTVTRTIPTSGGSLSATAADGTVFTLAIPDRALDADTVISLTPIAALDNLPLDGGLAGAVRLQPEGLQFTHPATLTITLSRGMPTRKQIGFSSSGDGSEWHLYPHNGDATSVTLAINHFSEYGLGSGTMGNVAAAGQHAPTSWQAQVEQLREMLDKTHDAQVAGEQGPYSPEEIAHQIDVTLQSRLEQDVLPKMEQALHSEDDAIVSGAIRDAFAWMRTVELAGDGDAYHDKEMKLMDMIVTAIANLLQAAERDCGTHEHQLVWTPDMGWINDPAGLKAVLKYAHSLALLDERKVDLYGALQHCKPHGLKFTGLQLRWTWTAPKGVTMIETHKLSGRVCGPEIDSTPWKFNFERTEDFTGLPPQTQSASDIPFTFKDGLFLPPPEHDNPADNALIFGAVFEGGSDVAVLLTSRTDPKIRVETHNRQTTVGSISISPGNNSAEAPIVEDPSCSGP